MRVNLPIHRKLRIIAMSVGALLMIVAVSLVALQLMANWSQIAPELTRMRPGFLIGSLLSVLTMLLLMGLGWTWALRAMGVQIKIRSGLIIYYRVSILRYLPGSLWHLPGRAYICQECGIPIPTFAQSAFLELFFLLSSCAIWSGWGIALFWDNAAPLLLSAIASGLSLLMIVRPQFALSLTASLGLKLRPARGTSMLGMLFIYCLVWLSYGTAILFLLYAIPGTQPPSPLSATAINSAAWAAGFLSFSPLGLGVRELGLSVMLGSNLGAAAIIASLVQRFMEMALEACLWLVAQVSKI